MMQAGQADAFADIRFALTEYQPAFPGSRIVDGSFGRNNLAIGFPKGRPQAASLLRDFMSGVVTSGFVQRSIDKARVAGAVVPAGP